MATQKNISISLEDAKQIHELFNICELADRHFKPCQSDLYRRHVSATCKAKNVSEAFARLKEKIEPDKGE